MQQGIYYLVTQTQESNKQRQEPNTRLKRRSIPKVNMYSMRILLTVFKRPAYACNSGTTMLERVNAFQ